jgi:hypothetical protein
MMPAKEDCLAMLQYFTHHTSRCLPRTIHVPLARSSISDFYLRTLTDREHRPVDTPCAAFILGICATSAFFWTKDAGAAASCSRLFGSEDDAARQAGLWLGVAWDLLDRARRAAPCSGSLLEVQALMVLSDLLYNTEGCSTRFRDLHGRTLAVAREISLHLIDADSGRTGSIEDESLGEVKRRVWWHIASTDWYVGLSL